MSLKEEQRGEQFSCSVGCGMLVWGSFGSLPKVRESRSKKQKNRWIWKTVFAENHYRCLVLSIHTDFLRYYRQTAIWKHFFPMQMPFTRQFLIWSGFSTSFICCCGRKAPSKVRPSERSGLENQPRYFWQEWRVVGTARLGQISFTSDSVA